ncbi:hypothetical protein FHR95_003347 [Halomonas fontilapidosi]|uniref:Uncharacterized protein n=1 Tax=Halomonas fontilapidosi TaxID=616675 RepID=A0A7W5DNM0_9GAMM|nr:hypothetical protein [Halomonas fontilapidosi]MBB3185754.1 hypothetical protein [Halomonas fontilapidosi]
MIRYDEEKSFELTDFKEIAGEDVVRVVISRCPKKVMTRVAKASDHFEKAKKLSGIDDEMGVIRLIAAEEELVVAIFELIKSQKPGGGRYKTYVKKFNNHKVKLGFYPVLSQVKHILSSIYSSGVALDGMQGDFGFSYRLVVENDKAVARIYYDDKGGYIDHNPMSQIISLEDREYDEVLESLYKEFEGRVHADANMDIKTFVAQRSDFRNKILYATDEGVASMGESLDDLISKVFSIAIQDLLWVLCVLSSYPLDKNADLLLKQFFELYGMILKEAGVRDIKPLP